MADSSIPDPVTEALEWVESLEIENENLRRQVFRAESVIGEYQQEAGQLSFELKKLRAELKLQQQINQPTV